MLYAYAAALLITAALTGFTARRKLNATIERCMVAVLLNWGAGMAVSMAGWTDAWPVNIALDTLTAVVILWHPAGRWQAALGVTYCVQLAMHIGYGVRRLLDYPADAMSYYDWLTWVAFLQLLIIGGWNLGLWGGGLVARWRGDRSASARPIHSRMEEP